VPNDCTKECAAALTSTMCSCSLAAIQTNAAGIKNLLGGLADLAGADASLGTMLIQSSCHQLSIACDENGKQPVTSKSSNSICAAFIAEISNNKSGATLASLVCGADLVAYLFKPAQPVLKRHLLDSISKWCRYGCLAPADAIHIFLRLAGSSDCDAMSR
jgi:hypothetical protein